MHLRDLKQYLSELSENNARPWFIMNKPRYDILREEFQEVVTELIKQITLFDKQVAACNPKKAMFRINRDIRFSKNITPNDLRRPSAGGGSTWYFQIDGNGILGMGAGEYLPPAPRLKAIRQHVLNDATGFAKILKNKALRATYGGLTEEDKLLRPPKGFDPDHPHIEALKLKSFFVWTEVKLDINAPDKLVPQLAQAFKDALPLVLWLRGVPELETEEPEVTA
jgi:uncharacterized protein (TIGR02453 family)